MRTLNISEETYNKIKDQIKESEIKDVDQWSDLLGAKMFFRTVTYHFTGRVKKIVGSFWELEDAAWQAYEPRLNDFLKKGTVNEVEPIGRMWINIESCTDFMPYEHSLPTEQK
ncbi:MAG: hypothetical protein GY861_03730 [bacterium]|nr:hypothetical protein [bacterium]